MLAWPKSITAEEFLEHAPTDKRSELVRGEIIEMAPASEELRVLTLDETLDGGDVLPGFQTSLQEIFQD